jgi:uncharacterized protein YdaU (DUF1376 family)
MEAEMSQAWMPMYWGDYLRDTRDLTTLQHGAYLLLIAHYWQHGKLPTDEHRLAVIAGVSFKKWKAIREPIADKFEEGWTHKRVAQELIRLESKMLQRSGSGYRGGIASGLSKNINAGRKANASVSLASSLKKHGVKRSETRSKTVAKTKQTLTNHLESITTTFPSAATPPVDNVDNGATKGPPRKEGKQARKSELPPGTIVGPEVLR